MQLFLAFGLLGGAIMDTSGFFGPGALAMATAAALLGLSAGAQSRWKGREPPSGVQAHGEAAGVVLALVVAIFLAYGLVKAKSSPDALPFLVAGGALFALEVRLVFTSRSSAWLPAPARLALWLALGGGLLFLHVRTHGGGSIDVFTFQQEAAAALLRGESPFSISYRNIYGDLRFYGPGVADAERVYAFPYPPETVLLGLPSFVLAGDVRYGGLVALAVAAWGLSRLAPRYAGPLAAAAVVFHPGAPRLLRSAFTEPLVLAAFVLLLLAVRRLSRAPPRGWVLAGLTGALVAGAKQYSPLLLAPIAVALPALGRARILVLAAALAGAIVLPFALWDPRGLWDGVALMQLRQPFRPDSLSWAAALVRLGLPPAPSWPGFAAAAAALALTWPRPRSLASGATCAAVAFLVLLLGAKQAFLNYYWLADGLLLTAALLHAWEEGS